MIDKEKLRARILAEPDVDCEIGAPMSERDDETAWLIETVDPVGATLYFCHDGDWCSNPNHAYKFRSAEQADAKLASMQRPKNFSHSRAHVVQRPRRRQSQ